MFGFEAQVTLLLLDLCTAWLHAIISTFLGRRRELVWLSKYASFFCYLHSNFLCIDQARVAFEDMFSSLPSCHQASPGVSRGDPADLLAYEGCNELYPLQCQTPPLAALPREVFFLSSYVGTAASGGV